MPKMRKSKSEPKPKSNPWIFAVILILAFSLPAGITFYFLKQSRVTTLPPTRIDLTEKPEIPHKSPERYAGSKSCEKCHAPEFQSWTNSHHALAERNVTSMLDLAAFDPEREIKHGSQTSRAARNGSQFEIVTSVENNERKALVPERVIGVEPLRQFLIPSDGGRLQTLEMAFDPHKQDWFDVFGEEDRKPGEWGHWTGRGMTWNTMCANCHNTRLRKNYDFATDQYKTTMAEMGVGCEACHGPMQDHVEWQEKHPYQKTAANSTPAEKDPTAHKLGREDYFSACGQCHSRRAELTADFVPGESFFDHFALNIPDETDIFYADGQVRDEDYEFTSFLGSKMHAANVRCMDCHNPHSAKTKLVGNALCLQCHGGAMTNAPVINPMVHSFHKDGSEGNNCTSCHMPVTNYMQRHGRRDHGFTIPDPLLTKDFGIPNACNRCHKDQSTDWALQAVEKWYGDKMNRSTRARAQVVAQARAGKDVTADLVKMLHDDKIPMWRASAATLLRNFPAQPVTVNALLSATSDTNAMVRTAAARTLAPLQSAGNAPIRTALQSLLQDPVRSVRIEAAWALHETLDTNSQAGLDLMIYLNHNSDQPVGALQLGNFYLSRDETQKALACLERAVQWDKNSAPIRHDLAIALSLSGKTEEALPQLEEACRLAPKEAEYRFKLALAFNELGRKEGALAALEETVKLDPQFSRAWYNLGLAYSGAEKLNKAMEALEKAESLNRSSAEIPYALATVLARMGLNGEAKEAAQRALTLQPNSEAAMQLLRQLESH